MILFKFVLCGILVILHNSEVFAVSDFQQAVDDFAEAFDELIPEENFNSDKEDTGITYVAKEPVNEIKYEKESVQLVGDEYNFDLSPSVWEKATQELQKINADLVLVNVTSFTGQVTNDVTQTMELMVSPKDCVEADCRYPCKIEFHSRGQEETVFSTCAVNVDKRERRDAVASIKRKVDEDEAKVLADFAVDTLDMFDVDSKKRVVKEIISATKELSNGVSYDLVMHVAVVACDESSSSQSCDDVVEGTDHLCKVKLYRSFDNNSTYKLTQSDCTPLNAIKSKSIENLKPEKLVGGWTSGSVDDDLVKDLALFSLPRVTELVNAPGLKLVEIVSAKTQVVSGINVQLKLKLEDDFKKTYLCDVSLYEQSWTDTRNVNDVQCNMKTNDVRNKRSLGGWQDASPDSDFIKELADFSMDKVGQKINSQSVKLIEIISAKTQVVSGKNVQMSLKIADDSQTPYLCDVALYDQSWTKTREVTSIQCSPIATNRRRRSDRLFGGWKSADVSDPFIKEVADFSLAKVAQSVNTKDVVLVEIVSAKTQVVSGQNIKLKLKVNDGNKASYTCDVTVYDQSWTNTRKVSNIECNPDTRNRKKRGDRLLGGWKSANVSDPFIQEVADFSMAKVAQTVNAKDVVLAQIVSAKTQVVSGQNIKLKLNVKDGNKVSYTCDVTVYDQSWTNTRRVSNIECNPDRTNKMKRADRLVGGWKSANVSDPFIKEVADFSMTKVGQTVNAKDVVLVEIVSAETQVVSGQNIKLKMKVKDGNKVSYTCDVTVYDQPWTNTRRVSNIECNPDSNNRKKRNVPGGWKSVDVSDPFIKEIAAFSMSRVGQTVNAKSVVLTEILAAQTQVVSGQNIQLKLKTTDSNKVDYICDVTVYDQSWTNTRRVTDIHCDTDSKRKQRDVLLGGWKTADVDDPFIKEVAAFGMTKVAQSINTKDVQMTEILSAKTQVVSGQNIQLQLRAKDAFKVSYLCDITVYDQPWTNTRRVTNMQCNPESKNRRRRGALLGGWKTADVDDPFIKEVAAFGMTKVAQSINAKDVQMTEILSAETQVVSGQNIRLKLKVTDANKVSQICRITVYDQPWTNTREVTNMQCTSESKDRRRRSRDNKLVGGYTPITDQDKISKYADFTLSQIAYSEDVNSPSGVKLVKVNKAEKQVVAGLNIRLDLTVQNPNDNLFNCVVLIWEQPWRHFKEVINVKCNPESVSENKRTK